MNVEIMRRWILDARHTHKTDYIDNCCAQCATIDHGLRQLNSVVKLRTLHAKLKTEHTDAGKRQPSMRALMRS